MKKIFFPFAFCALASGAYAQTSGWETGITLSGGRSMNIISHVSPEGEPFAGIIKSTDWASWSYSAGIYGRKFFKNMYGIEVGVQYTSFGLFDKASITFGDDVDPVNGFTGIPGFLRMNYRHNYVEVPIRFVFKKDLKKTFSIGCFAGVAPAVLTHAYVRSVYTYDGQRTVDKDNARTDLSNRFNLIADAGLLLRANISEHFSLDTRPFFRMTALPTYTEDTSPYFEERFMSAGVTVSSVWKF